MLRGAQKQMIVVKTGDSRYFDEAYFVLRHDPSRRATRRDMLGEANRILRESEPDPRPMRGRFRRGVLFFIGGLLCGGGICLAVCLLIL